MTASSKTKNSKNAAQSQAEELAAEVATTAAEPENAPEPAPELQAESMPEATEIVDDKGLDELEKLRAEKTENYNRYLRAVADLDNYRRRVQREKDELRQFAVADVVESLLPVIENLTLAVASAKQTTDPQNVVTGVSMVLEQFRTTLGAVGLAEINPAPGSYFDPHQHESLSHGPSDEVPAEKILQVVRAGFSLRGRLLRAANVVLSSGPAQPEEPSDAAEEVDGAEEAQASG